MVRQEYKLSDAFFIHQKRRLYIFSFVITLLFIGLLLKFQWHKALSSGILMGILVSEILVLGAVQVWTFRKSIRKQQTTSKSFRVIHVDNCLTLVQEAHPSVEIQRNEIIRIRESKRGLIVHTPDRHRTIGIPSTIEGYPELRSLLSTWMPITSKNLPDRL